MRELRVVDAIEKGKKLPDGDEFRKRRIDGDEDITCGLNGRILSVFHVGQELVGLIGSE